jgi:hypothetical protein
MSNHDNLIKTVATGEARTSSATEPSIVSHLSACERLVDKAIEKELPATILADSLKGLRLKAFEAIDYLKEFNQQLAICHSKTKQCDTSSGDPPDGEPCSNEGGED